MYIVRYTVRNSVLWISNYPNSNALLQFHLKECCKRFHPTKFDVINDVKLFPSVYRRIFCRNSLTLANQMFALQNQVH